MRFLAKVKGKYVYGSQIGSGKHAKTTDKTGKFWGNAGAGGVFYAKSTGRILLAYRSSYVNEPHTWGVWGGAIDGKENPTQAVRREIKEETGYQGDFQLKEIYVYKNGNFKYHNFLITVEEEFTPKLCWETEDFGWFDSYQIPKPLHFGLKALLPHLLKHLKT